MSSSSASRTAMPGIARTTEGQVGCPAVVPGRRGPHRARAEESESKHDADVFVARWLNCAIGLWGKATSYAEMIDVDLPYLSKMRSGEKPTPLRALLPLLGNTEAVLAFVAPLLESIGHVARPVKGPTFFQLAGAVLADLDDGSAVTRQVIKNAAAKRGWTEAQMELALRPTDTNNDT